MTTNQEGVHAAVRAETGTTGSYLSDWHALFDADAITAGPWGSRMIAWVNQTLGTSYTNLNDAMNAFAIDQGFSGWTDMNTLVLAVSGAMELLDGETQGLALDFTDDYYFDDTGFYGSMAVIDTGTPANDWDSSPTTTSTSKLTYTSPSVKMTMGPSGTLRYQAHNLCLQSEDLSNASWTAISTPTRTATTIQDTSAAAHQGVSQAITVVNGATYSVTYRIQKDAVSNRFPEFQLAGTTNNILTQINTSTGAKSDRTVTGTGSVSSVVDGGSYYDLTLSIVADATVATLRIYPALSTTIGGADVASQGTITVLRTHFRRTPSDSTYLSTTTASRFGLPLQWSSDATPVLEGLLVEEARTNFAFTNSDLSTASWTKLGTAAAVKNQTGPNGVANSATRMSGVGIAPTNDFFEAGYATARFSAGASIAFSMYIRKVSSTGTLRIKTASSGVVAWTVDFSLLGSGWERLTATHPAVTVSVAIVADGGGAWGPQFDVASGTLSFDVALVQIEAGAFPTSPIEVPSTSSVTRAADNISLATSAFPAVANPGTIFVKYKLNALSSAQAQRLMTLDDGTVANSIHLLGNNTAGSVDAVITTASAGQGFNNSAVASLNVMKQAFTYATNDSAHVINGGTPIADPSVTLPASFSALRLGQNTSAANQINGLIQQISLRPRRVANADVVTETT